MTKVTFATVGTIPDDVDIAEVWVGPDNKLHIRMVIDDAFDVVFDDSVALRPRSVSLGGEVVWLSSEIK